MGFDLDLINSVCELTVPIVCSGGAKNAEDFSKVFHKTNVSGAAAANFFHFTEHSVIITKSAIHKENKIRIETHANYSDHTFDKFYRLNKKSEKYLTELLNIKIEKEII